MPRPKKGERFPGSGRKKGKLNTFTISMKEAVRKAYDEMGGWEAMAEWGQANRTDFYKIAAKLIPTDLNMNGTMNINWPLPKTELDK